MYKKFFATVSNHPYGRGLSSDSKCFIHDAQINEQINYRQDDQFSYVQETFELLVVEPPVATVTPRIASFNCVNTYGQRNKKIFPLLFKVFVDFWPIT